MKLGPMKLGRMNLGPMNLGKAAAAGVCALTLGLQAWVTVPGLGHPEKLWPFTAYPMYSAPRTPSDSVRLREVRLLPCNPADSAVVVNYRAANLNPTPLSRYTNRAAEGTPEVLQARLGPLFPGHCTGQVLQRAIPIPPMGYRLPVPEPVVIGEFPLRPGSAHP